VYFFLRGGGVHFTGYCYLNISFYGSTLLFSKTQLRSAYKEGLLQYEIHTSSVLLNIFQEWPPLLSEPDSTDFNNAVSVYFIVIHTL